MRNSKFDQFLFNFKRKFWLSKFRLSRYYYGLQDLFYKSPREEILDTVMNLVSMCNVGGEYLEFGVFEGDSFIKAFNFAKRYGLNDMKFYAFDSFRGMPEITGVDIHDHPRFLKGQLSSGGVERFKKLIAKRGVDLRRVTLIPGWYEETLNQKTKNTLSLKKAAIVYIDCDLYASTVPVLNFILDYIQDGTIIIFDDWFLFNGHPDRGERCAFREWLDRNKHIRVSEYYKFGWHGNSFIIHL